MKIFTILASAFLLFVAAGCASKTTTFGVKDSGVESRIVRANNLIGLYHNKDYPKIEKQLNADLQSFKGDVYAEMRLMNELATLYSNFLFDLERAVELDRQLLSLKDANPPKSDYYLGFNSANNRTLADDSYKKNFINLENAAVMDSAKSRLRRNEALLKANPAGFEKSYSKDELIAFMKDAKADLVKCYKGTSDYYEISSRLIRAEYELYRLTKDKAYIDEGYKMILKGDIGVDNIFFSEIDFIALSDYLRFAYFKTENEKLAEYSLAVIYKPYMNIRSHEHRWLYNQMINNRINILIDAYYKKGQHDTMLYYISLNKSRMVLEDKVKLLQDSNLKSQKNDYFDESTGLPNMAFFRKKLSSADAFLDFYVDGHYTGEQNQDNKNSDFRTAYATAGDVTKTRSIVLSNKGGGVFDSDYVYITYVNKGKITAIRKDHKDLESLRANYRGPIDQSAAERNRAVIMSGAGIQKDSKSSKNSAVDLASFVGMPLAADLTVSPDGWLSSYPLSMLLNTNVVRTLNVFTYGHPDTIGQARVAGYYNPTLDLPEAEQEKAVIENLFPGSQSFVRQQAGLEQLRKPLDRNILHLSMHGYFNVAEPDNSFLAFAGSLKQNPADGSSVPDDLGKALKVNEMYSLQQLRDNDLVFTAACQTGLTAKGAGNESEVMGIMRPLLINNNKNIILTLWEVETRSAADFVKSFYENLAKSKNVRSAFMAARDEIKNKYKEPKFWAPYVLVQND